MVTHTGPHETTRVIGLTGGIASGKSTVADLLAERGVPVIDADQIAREVVRPGQPALDEIVATFGRAVLGPDGSLDRKALGRVIFADPQARHRLNTITHPRIAEETRRRIARLAEQGVPLVIYEAALIVENGLQAGLDGLIVVAVDESTQLARLCTRDGLTVEEAHARLAAQAPLAEKVAAATWVIDNRGTLESTRAQVDDLCRALRRGDP